MARKPKPFNWVEVRGNRVYYATAGGALVTFLKEFEDPKEIPAFIDKHFEKAVPVKTFV